MIKRAFLLLCATALTGCGQWVEGEVVGVAVESSCIHASQVVTVRLVDGRLLTICADAPVGTRVTVCDSGPGACLGRPEGKGDE